MTTFPERPDRPEIPYPFPPYREPPRRTDPVLSPIGGLPEGDPVRRLFDRRTVMVSGPLDHDAVSRLCAQLMALDGQSAGDVDLIVNSPGGPIDEIGAVLDVIELMRAKVNTACIGAAKGTAGIVVASGTGRRRAGSNAIISVRCDRTAPSEGTADDLAQAAGELELLRRRLQDVLGRVTGQPVAAIANELVHGGAHDATDALALGLIDEIGRAPR